MASVRTGRKPMPKEVVELLMTKKGETTKDVLSRHSGAIRRNVVHCIFECPKATNCKVGGEITFEKGRGYTNGYRHLTSCVSSGDEDHLLAVYHDAVQDRRHNNNSSFSGLQGRLSLSASPREKAMLGYIELITSLSLPVNYVENATVRNFSKHNDRICAEVFKETIFKLVELVEGSIKNELVGTVGAIMHDGWTSKGTHYLGVFAVYMRRVKIMVNGVLSYEKELAMPLISLSPMANVCDDEDEEERSDEETTEFGAKTRIRQFEDVFNFYGVNVHEWAICQLADNCNLNKCIARLLEIPHVGCTNHKLNLEVNAMVKSDLLLSKTLESVHQTMTQCRTRITNRAILRNLTALSPILHNATRWSGKYSMLERFGRIYGELIQVADTEGASVTIERSSVFKNRTAKYTSQLKEINTVTLELQRRGATLSDCRLALDALIETISVNKDNSSTPFYRCKLGTRYISIDSPTSPDSAFESGVVKIQRNETDTLTDAERDACVKLRVSSADTAGENNSTSRSATISMEEIIMRKKRKREEQVQTYANCDFILGSTAEVERLWSIAKYVLTENRTSMTPLLFEALVFLKVNRTYWNQNMVSTAMSNRRSDLVNQRMQEDAEYTDLA